MMGYAVIAEYYYRPKVDFPLTAHAEVFIPLIAQQQ